MAGASPDTRAAKVSPETLLAGITIEAFNDTIREKAYRKFSRALSDAQAANLFGIERLDALLTAGSVPPQQIDIIHNGWPQTLDEAQGRSGEPNPRLLAERFSRGATVRIRDLQWFDAAVDAFRRDIQAVFLAPCQINMYLTPPRQAGFSPHFDSHDVFIVQCQGRKRWRIRPVYANMTPLPLSSTPFDASRYPPEDRFDEFMLDCGDTLYIPRGVMHEAACDDRESIHLTVSLTPLTANDVLAKVLARAARNDVAFRSLLFGNDDQSPDALRGLAAGVYAMIEPAFTESAIQDILAEHLDSLHATPLRTSKLASLVPHAEGSPPEQNVGERIVGPSQEGIAHAAQSTK